MPYVVSVLAVSTTGADVLRGSVQAITFERAPTERSPLRIANIDAPGMQFKKTSIPRNRSSAS